MTPDDEREIRARIRQYAIEKKWPKPTLGPMMKPTTDDMGQLACSKCGLEVVLDEGEIRPCSNCGGMVFVPFRLLDWSTALSANDRKFLASIRVASS